MSSVFSLSNREVSMLVWTTIFILWVISIPGARKFIFKAIALIVTSQLLTLILLMIAYTLAILNTLHYIDLWAVDHIKDTLLWFFGVAIVMAYESSNKKGPQEYLRAILKDLITATVALEFIINFYVFSLPVELILVPIVSVLSILIAYMESAKENSETYDIAIKGLKFIFAGIGVIITLVSLSAFIKSPDALITLSNIKGAIVPILLTLGFLPFLFFLMVYMSYESSFIRILFSLNRDPKLTRYAQGKLLLKCGFNIAKLRRIEQKLVSKRFNNRKDLSIFLKTQK